LASIDDGFASDWLHACGHCMAGAMARASRTDASRQQTSAISVIGRS